MVYYGTTLTLFSTEIDPRRNLFIDEIGQYLDSIASKVTFQDFKRFTPSQSVTIKLSTEDAESAIGAYLSTRYNYARVVYGDATGSKSFSWYYFVSSIEMIADGTLEVVLQLDALNSFRNWKGALTDRTFVVRHLIDRWDENGYPITEFTPEDIGGEIIKETKLGFTPSPGYLVYRNTASSMPALYLLKDTALPVVDSVKFDETLAMPGGVYAEGGYGLRFTAQSAVIVTLKYDVNGEIQTKQKTYSTGESATVYYARTMTEDGIYCYWGGGSIATAPTSVFSLSIDGVFSGEMLKTALDQHYSPTHTSLGKFSIAIKDINRTDADICKIIKIPYVYPSGGYFTARGDKIIYQLSDIEARISATVGYVLLPSQWGVTKTTYSSKLDDPKIWSGSYCYVKVYYDSYTTSFALDNMIASSKGFAKPMVTFSPSSTMSSSCIFQITDENGWGNVKEDFPFMICSDRNNELPLYTSEWLNYLRVGYNYDKKSNALGIISSLTSTLGSIISGVATVASGGALSAATVPTMVSMGASAIHGWTNTASAINSQTAKETQMRSQSFSVSSINDLSLFELYGNGEVKYDYWKPKDEYRDRLATLFFYRGYSVNRQYKPSLDIRTDFDYIECVPSWSGTFIKQTPPQFISLLNERLGEGVTVIHDNNGAWDIAQEKGNIER